ncbi:hypothetical protein ALC57_15063 [Trachymyrmex cornetzi]|uniref:Uncharacterized protein n=1 Tax=Trachymyrmex cornetzi TaxID=471704 RepID=A0A195DJW7_9HYME|nr:hypothetical protein ALC57_15063 [Trachymyrmex cornetzi]
MNGRFFLSLAHPEMRFRDIAELSAGKYDEITVWVRIEEGTRVEKSRSRFVIHIRVSEDKAIKSPRASGCGADSPGLPRRIKLTDPPGTQRESGGRTVCGKRRDRDASKSCYATFRAFPTFRASAQRVPEVKRLLLRFRRCCTRRALLRVPFLLWPIFLTVPLGGIREGKKAKREKKSTDGAIFLSRSSRARDSRQLAFVAPKNRWSLQKQRISVCDVRAPFTANFIHIRART